MKPEAAENTSPMTGRESISSNYDPSTPLGEAQRKQIETVVDTKIEEFEARIGDLLEQAAKNGRSPRAPVGQADIDLHMRAEDRFKENQDIDVK